jgi:hypothetical protein
MFSYVGVMATEKHVECTVERELEKYLLQALYTDRSRLEREISWRRRPCLFLSGFVSASSQARARATHQHDRAVHGSNSDMSPTTSTGRTHAWDLVYVEAVPLALRTRGLCSRPVPVLGGTLAQRGRPASLVAPSLPMHVTTME